MHLSAEGVSQITDEIPRVRKLSSQGQWPLGDVEKDEHTAKNVLHTTG
jgi:hypothetical protein